MIYFVLPYPPSKWEEASSDLVIQPQDYVQELMARWPDAESYSPSNDPGYVLRWRIVDEGEVILFGGLQDDLQTIAVEPADREPLANFVIWHRRVIPSQQELYLTWEGVLDSLEVTDETTAIDIIKFTGLVA